MSPLTPKLSTRRDQSLAEQVVPDAVDDDPRSERILRAGQPLGQFQPAALLGR